MILYLPEPFEFGMDDKKPAQSFTLKLPSGGELVVESCGHNQVRIVEIRSTEPMDYINSRYQPGNTIDLIPKLE